MLKKIQSIEDSIIFENKGSESLLFTQFMYETKEWCDITKPKESKSIDTNMYKLGIDKDVDKLCYYIECGYTTPQAIQMIGKDVNTYRASLTELHKKSVARARMNRFLNKKYNLNKQIKNK